MAETQYVIDIATEMPHADVSIDQLDAINSKLTNGGRAADVYGDAIKRASEELGRAKGAQADANASVREAEALMKAYTKESGAAQKALEQASRRKDPVGRGEQLALEVAADQANAKLFEQVEILERLKSAQKAAQGEAAHHTNVLGKLTRLQGAAATVNQRQAEKLEKLGGSLRSIGGPMNLVADAVEKRKAFLQLSHQVGASQAAMVTMIGATVAVSAAVVALTLVIVAGTIALAAWAVGLADGARNAELNREAAEALTPALAGLRGTIDDLGRSTGVEADVLRGYAKTLADAKVSAKDLPAALRAVATAEAAIGKGAGSQFVDKIKAGSQSVDALARDVDQKFGGIVAKRMRGLDAQGKALSKNMGGLFGGLKIEPVYKALDRLVEFFGETSASGKAVKLLFETVFQPLIDQAESAMVVLEAFALGFLIGLTKVYLAVRPVIRTIKELFGFESDAADTADTMAMVSKAAEFMAYAFAAVAIPVAAVVAAFGVFIGLLALIPAAIAAVTGGLIYGLVKGFTLVKDTVIAVVEWFKAVPWGDLATAMIDGIVGGLVRGAGRVWDAMKGVALGAVDAAEKALGIASPSKRLAETGKDTADGMADGVERSTPKVRRAMADMVEPPPANVAGAAQAGASAVASSSATVSGNTFIFHGVPGMEDAEKRFGDLMTRLLEGDATALGSTA